MHIIDFVNAAAENAEEGKVISITAKIKAGEEPEIRVEELPDFESMTRGELEAYRTALEEELDRLDSREPENMNSRAYEDWADAHEELEDLVDEVQDLLDDMED